MRERAGHIAVGGDLAGQTEAEALDLRSIRTKPQAVARCAEAALQINLIARHRQRELAWQNPRTRQLDRAATRHWQVVVDALAEFDFGLGRERGAEDAGRCDRAVDACLDLGRRRRLCGRRRAFCWCGFGRAAAALAVVRCGACGRARRHLRSQSERVEIGQLCFQVVCGTGVVLDGARKIDPPAA